MFIWLMHRDLVGRNYHFNFSSDLEDKSEIENREFHYSLSKMNFQIFQKFVNFETNFLVKKFDARQKKRP